MTDDKHREAFEKWILSLGQSVDRFFDGSDVYSYPTVDMKWSAWQAAMRYRDEKEGKV